MVKATLPAQRLARPRPRRDPRAAGQLGPPATPLKPARLEPSSSSESHHKGPHTTARGWPPPQLEKAKIPARQDYIFLKKGKKKEKKTKEWPEGGKWKPPNA